MDLTKSKFIKSIYDTAQLDPSLCKEVRLLKFSTYTEVICDTPTLFFTDRRRLQGEDGILSDPIIKNYNENASLVVFVKPYIRYMHKSIPWRIQ